MTTREKDFPGMPNNGGRFAGPKHAEPEIPALADEAASPDTSTLVGRYGTWEVPASSHRIATEVAEALDGVPYWSRTEKAMEWATSHGFEATTEDDYRSGDNAHGHGVIMVDEDDVSIGLANQGQRNFYVDLEGGNGRLEPDDDGRIGSTAFIYPR